MMRTSVLGGLLVGLALAGCSEPTAKVERQPTAVKVKRVESGPGPLEARYSGTLEAATKVDVAFRAGGYVESLGTIGAAKEERVLEVGDPVKKGQLLARIKSGDYSQRLTSAKARTAEAKAQAKLAEQDLERANKLFESKVVSKAELDAKIARHESALASVDGAFAQAGEASVALDDTVIRAPMDGVVLARKVEAGSLVNPGTVAFVIADTSRVKVMFGAPQSLVERLSIGDSISVVLAAGGDRKESTINAPITRIAPAADGAGRLFAVESSLANPAGTLRPGSVVTVRIPETTVQPGSLVVPLGAVVRAPTDARGFAVFVVPGGETTGAAELREVALGNMVGNGVTVTSGLALGDRVVTVGASLLRDGAQAVVIP